MKTKGQNLNSGFTLMELTVAIGLFLFVILSIIGIYSLVTSFQRETTIFQKLQGEIRFALETMTREIRMGILDYDSYSDLSSGKSENLILLDSQEKRICFKKDNDFLKIAKDTNCSQWHNLVSEKIKIKKLDFYISPRSNPFFKCQENTDCKSLQCDQNTQLCQCPTGSNDECLLDQTCKKYDSNYYCKNPDIQPRITIVLKGEIEEKAKKKEINLQTTVSSRIYQR